MSKRNEYGNLEISGDERIVFMDLDIMVSSSDGVFEIRSPNGTILVAPRAANSVNIVVGKTP